MKVVLLAHDVAPSQALKMIEKELMTRDLSVWSYLGNGGEITADPSDIAATIRNSDVVLLGMSSSEKLATEEIAAAEAALEHRTPYGFYADIYKCVRRPWFERVREGASFVFVINSDEATAARELFPNAKVVISGNPLWEDFFMPKRPREEVREKLEVASDETMVLCPGGKSAVVNILHWGGVIEALSDLSTDPKHWKIFLALHPGDKTPPDFYQDLVTHSRVPAKIVAKEFLSSSEMLSGCDLVIESCSTIGIEAACLRKPVISYLSEIALGRLEKGSGSRSWELCVLGVAEEVRGEPMQLANCVGNLLDYGGAASLLVRQAEVYPEPPERGSAVRKMIATLAEIVS